MDSKLIGADYAPAQQFNNAVEAFQRGDIADSAAALRLGFFENLYVAPTLLGEKVQEQSIWHAGPQAEPQAAKEYSARYRGLWEADPQSLGFLRLVWNDPLVRSELKSYINLLKSMKRAHGEKQRVELLKERERFLNPARIIRTQSEILRRVARADLQLPLEKPFLGLVMLSAHDPAAAVDFYRKLFGIEPVRSRNIGGGYAEFEFQGLHVAIHGYNHQGQGDPYRLGPPPLSFGWGAFFVIRVQDFDRYYQNAVTAGIEVIDCELKQRGSRFFVVKDPSGYVFEITEEGLRGLAEE